ncbi:sugar phosphate isomerase/epimerase [Schaedlerella arabinosiphila]|jgi:sugar phosphate isomerase/epimerase|uniref:Sugar phosphate isomerase/epimerase n=1 Tax=Schaedlerella arabinosiphila TaxID=2044587 RepID=A0A3R8JSC4_9FIRM|nr:TIM barrel protein [Schaedlerella arabinosiphila]RRK33934.1 sugar phosphate isomerase/epimerase [Schaedlerella arabinosiphila]
MYQYDKKGPKRGIALYSYSAEFGISKNLEDCLEDMYDMGAHGLEILANTHIEGYPYPSDEWVEEWFRLLDKYEIVPVEYGNWIDSHVLGDRDLTTEESCKMLERDLRLAHRLGFTVMRAKMPVISGDLSPVKNWREIIQMALPTAEECNIKMCPEIHAPTNLSNKLVHDYVEFIEKTGTKYFGLNIDFGVFRNVYREGERRQPGFVASKPEEIIPLLPYIYCCHAKFNNMSDDFEETTIPYREIIEIMKQQGWDGYLLSEYEGRDKYDLGYEVGQTLRKHHILLKDCLGD